VTLAQSLSAETTMAIAHGGGKRIEPASREYRVLAGWIHAGTPRPRPQDPRVTALNVFPPLSRLALRDTQQIVVRADYSDGTAKT